MNAPSSSDRFFPLPRLIVLLGLIGLLGSGCSSTARRAGAITAGASAAGALGYALAPDKPAVAAGAAVAGAGLTALALGPDRTTYQEGLDRGYELGTGDAIKRHYWLRQAAQREQEEGARASGRRIYYTLEFTDSQETPDGRKLVPHAVTVPVIEPGKPRS